MPTRISNNLVVIVGWSALAILPFGNVAAAFQPLGLKITGRRRTVLSAHYDKDEAAPLQYYYQPKGVFFSEKHHDKIGMKDDLVTLPPALSTTTTAAAIAAFALVTTTPTCAVAADATAGPLPSAAMAWLHFLGIMGVSGGLLTERLVLKKQMSVADENLINLADLIYGLSAFSLLITGYFRATSFAKGWDFYKNEPIFWIKMSSVAVLGALSLFPAIVFFRRDQARKAGSDLAPLSDALVDRLTTIINTEISALLTIPLLATLMARGVLYVQDFPWGLGAALYVVSLGGFGLKYGKEALDMMEAEQALVPLQKTSGGSGSSDEP